MVFTNLVYCRLQKIHRTHSRNFYRILKKPENATIVITHYQRLLDYIVPDVVHVLYDGRIVKTAGKELVAELEEKGYDWIKEEVKGK